MIRVGDAAKQGADRLMLASYIFVFCRIVTGLVFALSSKGKVLHFSRFEQTVIRFDILPRGLSRLAALVFLCGEFAVIALILAGGEALRFGFSLGALLLLTFSAALASVLARNIKTSCNCFGSAEEAVSPYDLVRNAGFIACALQGLVLITVNTTPIHLGVSEWILAAGSAVVFVIVWVRLGEIVRLFRQE